MLKIFMKSVLSASICMATIIPVSAAQVMPQRPNVQVSENTSVIEIRNKRRGFYRQNNRGYYNGHRGYRHRRPGYRNYNGLWFPPAAFALGVIIGGGLNQDSGVRPGYTNPQHVSWCYNKYRSYRERDNTFQPYNGGRRECRSPFY